MWKCSKETAWQAKEYKEHWSLLTFIKYIITLEKLLQEGTPYFSFLKKKFIGQAREVDEQVISVPNSYRFQRNNWLLKTLRSGIILCLIFLHWFALCFLIS